MLWLANFVGLLRHCISYAGPVVGGLASCTVEMQASVNEQINGTTASYSGPACVVVQDNLDGTQCQEQALMTMRAYELITDIGRNALLAYRWLQPPVPSAPK